MKETSQETLSASVLTGGGDRPYALGLASCLLAQGIAFDFIGSDAIDSPELHENPLVRYFNLRGDQRSNASALNKLFRVFRYYCRLLAYAARAKPRIFHILWNNKLEYVDRTLVLLYYRLLGKRIVLTAHNVNIRKRDGHDTALNRLTLAVQYRLAGHIFVHTERMKRELLVDFALPETKCTVIPFGINSTVPDTALTPAQARVKLGLAPGDQVLLFFGNIAPYKGLEFLVEALALVAPAMPQCRLLITGRTKGSVPYWESIKARIQEANLQPFIKERIEYVPDEDTEIYFKAADVLILPYTHIFQSGVLSLGYNFGLPVIASNVGALADDIVEGTTGFLCRAQDPADLAEKIRRYFASSLYQNLATRRAEIQAYAKKRYSWTTVGELTKEVYRSLLRAG